MADDRSVDLTGVVRRFLSRSEESALLREILEECGEREAPAELRTLVEAITRFEDHDGLARELLFDAIHAVDYRELAETLREDLAPRRSPVSLAG